jgi:transcriptional regulator with XRE-family HTH domain
VKTKQKKEAPKINKRFGDRLRTLRRKRRLSQEEFADIAGLDRSYIGIIERGDRNVSLKKVAMIADALGVSLSDLLCWDAPPNY